MRGCGGIADSPEDLHHANPRKMGKRMHRIGHGEQRLAPGGNADHLPVPDGRLQIKRCGVTEIAQQFAVGPRPVDDDHILQPIQNLQPLLQAGIGAGRGVDADAYDAFRLSPLQEA